VERLVDDLAASGVAGADHGKAGAVGHAVCPPWGLGGIGGRQEHHGIIEHRSDLQRPCVVRADIEEGHVDVAGLHGGDQFGTVPRLTQHDFNAGPARNVVRGCGRTLVPTLGGVPTRSSHLLAGTSARKSATAELMRPRMART
jgi:hypothetical protein